jgi:hypothetical protein
MKKLIASLLLSLVGFSVCGQITAGNPEFDQFSYTPVGADLTGQTNPNGMKWVTCGTISGTAEATIASGNLTVSGLLNPAGNSVTWGGGTAGTACTVLPLTGKTSISGNAASSVFYSLALSVASGSKVPTSQAFVLGFVSGVNQNGQTSAPGFVGGRLYIVTNTAAQGDYSIGINKADGTVADTVYEGGATPTAYAAGTTHFIVVEYTFSGAENGTDTIAMWVDPNTSTFGAASPPISDPSYVTVTTSGGYGGADVQSGTPDSINGFEFRQVSSITETMIADELSIGVKWADVTPVNPPATAAFSGLSSVSSAYDTTFTLTGTVSAPGPLYPAVGEGVSVTINGVTENTTITGSAGQFTINYVNCNAPIGGPATITYHYSGPTLGPCAQTRPQA